MRGGTRRCLQRKTERRGSKELLSRVGEDRGCGVGPQGRRSSFVGVKMSLGWILSNLDSSRSLGGDSHGTTQFQKGFHSRGVVFSTLVSRLTPVVGEEPDLHDKGGRGRPWPKKWSMESHNRERLVTENHREPGNGFKELKEYRFYSYYYQKMLGLSLSYRRRRLLDVFNRDQNQFGTFTGYRKGPTDVRASF